MTVTKYILVELDPIEELDQIMKFLEDSFKTDKETRFRRLKGTGPYTVFVKAEAIDASVEDLIGKRRLNMSRWFDAQVQKEKNFQRRQKIEFEKHAVELRREIDEAKAAYREYPYERTKKYIDSRIQELEDMDTYLTLRDPDMERNYTDEIEELCAMLVGMSVAFATAAPAEYTEFKSMNGKIRRVLQVHGGA